MPGDLLRRPRGLRRELRAVYRRAAGFYRLEPSVLLIGAMKSATTSLFSYLVRHPDFLAPLRKEIHYFDWNYRRGRRWYLAHFPSRFGAREGAITGEATPYYLMHPLAAGRAHELLPEARLLAILRDPVDRAFSHYQHMVRAGREQLSFEDALAAEEERLRGEEERLRSEPAYRSRAHIDFSYLARGRYAEQLDRWLEHYRREQLLVVSTEGLRADPAATLEAVQRFVGLAPEPPGDDPGEHRQSYSGLAPTTRRELAAYFAPHNARLYELLGRDLGWTAS